MKIHDILIVGSGCSAAMSAQTLIDNDASVFMLDAGVTGKDYRTIIPDKDFIDLRKTEDNQHEYLVGKRLEGVQWGAMGKGAQLTPPRHYMTDRVDQYEAIQSKDFSPVESLGYGGLGIGWGVQCWEYSDADIDAVGLNKVQMRAAYKVVSERIGVSATNDDAARYSLGSLDNFQSSPRMDKIHRRIHMAYLKHKNAIESRGFFMGRTPLALITEEKDGRKAYQYKDMDYYSDNDRSAWRPWMTIDALKKRKNFTYQSGYFVESFIEKKDYIEVNTISMKDDSRLIFYCKKLILATGALSTGRIVLRSQGDQHDTLPILCNPYTYVPCLHPYNFGKDAENKKMGFAQLSLFLDENFNDTNISIASTYSYQSLMLFRIILQMPFNFVDARTIMRYLASGLVIMGIHHPDSFDSNNTIRLIKDKNSPTGDKLKINYSLNNVTKKINDAREKKFVRIMRKMNVFAIKRINPGYGSSIHYAGTVPFSHSPEKLHLNPDGRLHGTKSIFVADSSGFNYLPSRGLTFSLMANAHLVAERVLKNE